MRCFDRERLRDLLENGDMKPTLVLGAGASRPIFPTADKLKKEIVKQALRCATGENNPTKKQINAALRQPHLTLELLCSMLFYRCPQSGMSGSTELMRTVCDLSQEHHLAKEHAYSAYFALLVRSGLIGPILTTNFDTLLTSAIPDVRVITDKQIAGSERLSPANGEICALHGTFHTSEAAFGKPEQYTLPSTTTAHGLVRPLNSRMEEYVVAALKKRPAIFIGYSGNDHFDINPILFRMAQAGDAKEWHWLCYPNPSDVSGSVRRVFKRNLFRATPDDLFYGYCRELSDVPKPSNIENLGWKNRLKIFFDNWNANPREFSDFLQDIAANFHGAWLAANQYYLVSIGFHEEYSFELAGVPLSRPVKEKSEKLEKSKDSLSGIGKMILGFIEQYFATRKVRRNLRFHGGSHFAELFLAQYTYGVERDRLWKFRDRFLTSQPSDAKKLSRATVVQWLLQVLPAAGYLIILNLLLFARTRRWLARASRHFERQGDFQRPEDRAMALVGKGMVANLSGLILSDQAQAITRLMERTSAAGSVIQKRRKIHATLQKRIVENRALAKSDFKECIRLCKAADVLLRKHKTSGAHFSELIPYPIWEMCADENWSRTIPMLHRARELKRCLRRRIDRIHKEKEFDESMGADVAELLLAELPQTWLRAAELLRAVFKIENGPQLPPVWSSLTDKEKEDAALALKICRDTFAEYHESCRYNRLYPAYFEAMLLESISKENHNGVHAIVEKTREYRQDGEYGDQSWAQARVLERIEDRYQAWHKNH